MLLLIEGRFSAKLVRLASRQLVNMRCVGSQTPAPS
jgi:hypothetical protein